MPVRSDDITYQPTVDKQTFAADSPSKRVERRQKTILLLIVEIFTLLIIFAVVLAALNYFKIISFSSLYPTKVTNNNFMNTNTNTNTNKVTVTPAVKPPNQSIVGPSDKKVMIGILSQATQDQISVYAPSDKSRLINFKVNNSSVFQRLSTDGKTVKKYTFEQFKETMVSATNYDVRIEYINNDSENIVSQLTFYN